MPHPHEAIPVWSVEGRFQHLIYSPKGAVEGVLIDTDGISTQFVIDPHDPSVAEQFTGLRAGQTLVVEGIEAGPSPKGEPAHTVYAFERLASVDGKEPATVRPHEEAAGTVVRFNYAKHGAANGVVLDNGDFIHTRPEGLDRLGLKIGDKVKAEGAARPLVTSTGRVIEARSVNGKPVAPAH
ncbi:hypothetical protein [Variovorax sp. KK3]|uniref:hypothetical protein n=1 Tax=Variovorax sp. KK3 TaxID=1855728 RepID=UPI00097CB5F2|nr:hypothetical protein [Variovorax sp. KK3]